MAKRYLDENVDEQDYSSSNTSSKLTFLLVGSGIGAALALLFAPKSGRELRTDIADATRKGYDKTRETAQQLKEHSNTYYQQLKGPDSNNNWSGETDIDAVTNERSSNLKHDDTVNVASSNINEQFNQTKESIV